MKTLILGFGNTILSDDGVGIKVAQEIKKRISDVEVKEASISGLSILEEITGYDRVVVIDSIKTHSGEPGELYKFCLDDFKPTIHLSSPHEVNFATAIELGRKYGYELPNLIDIYAIEIEDDRTFSEECTERIKKAIPDIVEQIIEDMSGRK